MTDDPYRFTIEDGALVPMTLEWCVPTRWGVVWRSKTILVERPAPRDVVASIDAPPSVPDREEP